MHREAHDHLKQLSQRIKSALPFLFQQNGQQGVWEWVARAAAWRVVASLEMSSSSACPRLRFETICLKTHQRVHAWSQNILLHGLFEPRVARAAGLLIALTQNRLRCPHCRVPLDLVTRYDGQQFFGCPRWPNCQWTASIADQWYVLKHDPQEPPRRRAKFASQKTTPKTASVNSPQARSLSHAAFNPSPRAEHPLTEPPINANSPCAQTFAHNLNHTPDQLNQTLSPNQYSDQTPNQNQSLNQNQNLSLDQNLDQKLNQSLSLDQKPDQTTKLNQNLNQNLNQSQSQNSRSVQDVVQNVFQEQNSGSSDLTAENSSAKHQDPSAAHKRAHHNTIVLLLEDPPKCSAPTENTKQVCNERQKIPKIKPDI